MRKILLLLLAAVVAAAALGGGRGTRAQTNSEYFPEFGHFVMGEFYNFYRSTENPVELYGYPITEAFQNANGLTVQYFEKARFELHPAEPPTRRVKLSPLGEYLYEAGQPQVLFPNTAPCRPFEPDGRLVCYDFLEFYEANDGAARFGPPISNVEMLKDTRVQYFQNVRLEWRPGINGKTWIKVSDLGRQYFYHIGEDPRRLNPVERGENRIEDILRLKARAFPLHSVTARKGSQTVYVLVHDQRSTPIEAVDVAVLVRWPSGAESRFIAAAPTNAQGIAQVTFPVSSNEIGLATIEIQGSYNRIPIRTVTSFRIWW
jgi:hypothetical protein